MTWNQLPHCPHCRKEEIKKITRWQVAHATRHGESCDVCRPRIEKFKRMGLL